MELKAAVSLLYESLPVVYVVQPVQQRVDVSDLQLVVSDGLQSPSNRLVVTLHVHLKGQRSNLKSKVTDIVQTLMI